MRPTFRLFAVLSVVTLLGPGCKDEGASIYSDCKERYAGLVAEHVSPKDFRYQSILDDLAKIPVRSGAYEQAKNLTKTINGARGGRPEAPMARGANRSDDSPAERKRAECESLAASIGHSAENGKELLRHQLRDCENQAAALQDKE